MKPFIVLGNVDIPKSLLKNRMYFLPSARGPYGWEYRNELGNRMISSDARTWHQDNAGQTPAMLLWTNAYPTEVKLPGGKVVSGKPNDVVLIDNKAVRHRTPLAFPLDASYTDRHFLRFWLRDYPDEAEIAKLQQELRDAKLRWGLTEELRVRLAQLDKFDGKEIL